MARTATARRPKPDPHFPLRWSRALRDLRGPLSRLYGGAHDLPTLLDRMRALCEAHSVARPADLRALDLCRDLDPDWFLGQEMVAYVCYVDRFCGTLRELPSKIPYL